MPTFHDDEKKKPTGEEKEGGHGSGDYSAPEGLPIPGETESVPNKQQ